MLLARLSPRRLSSLSASRLLLSAHAQAPSLNKRPNQLRRISKLTPHDLVPRSDTSEPQLPTYEDEHGRVEHAVISTFDLFSIGIGPSRCMHSVLAQVAACVLTILS